MKNSGKIEKIFIDVENKKSTILANTVMPPVRMKADKDNLKLISAPMNAFIFQTLANMYELRKQPHSSCNTQKDLSDAFFDHIKCDKDGDRLLPYEENWF